MSHSAMPPYYTWIVDKLLAVSALPYHHTHLNYLSNDGIQIVVSISDEQFRVPYHTNPKLKFINLRSDLSLSDCHVFVNLMLNAKARGEGVLVHSTKGLDKAAVLVACFLVRLWECPSDYAVDNLRMMRPTSLRILQDEILVHEFHKQIAHTFSSYYADTSIPKWGNKTDFLGSTSAETYFTADQSLPESYKKRVQFTE